jgi:guanylate kinase
LGTWVKGAGELPGHLVVISGPSGAGKSTLIRRALERPDVNARLSVSVTTRPPRMGEREGVEYFFLSREQFQEMLRNNELLESAPYNHHHYGTPARPVLEAMERGECVVLEIEIEGAKQIRQFIPEALFVFIDVPSFHELSRRLRARRTESDDSIHGRLVRAREEREHGHWYDARVINDDLDQATDDLVALLVQHGCGG